MMIVLGWMLMSASPNALLIGVASIVVLAVAPLAEEPWLVDQYGEEYQTYKSLVRRFV
jgi:protein-S-isoprenylcysteine O-methyltransferase Ste14